MILVKPQRCLQLLFVGMLIELREAETLPPEALNYTAEMNRTLASPEFAPLIAGVGDTATLSRVLYVIRAMNYSPDRAFFLEAIRMHQPVIFADWSNTKVGGEYADCPVEENWPSAIAFC